jgi:exopolyphosphatase / guanosine-5'-triphosphate,3'-diphosphate pyrophosphatase
MRRASIDIGANSVRLLVVELGPPLVLVHDDGCLTRLGDSIAATGAIEGSPLDATTEAVQRYADDARRLGAEPTCFATAGLRDARNTLEAAEALTRAARAPVHVISGGVEAELAYLGTRAGAGHPPSSMAILDVGGGSTEIAHGGERLSAGVSRPVGARRLLAAFPALGAEAPVPAEVFAAAAAAAREALFPAGEPSTVPADAELYGMGGTITTLAAMALGLTRYDAMAVNDFRLDGGKMRALRDELAALELPGRRARLLEPERADLLLAGTVIAEEALIGLGRSELTVSVYSLRLGALTDAGSRLLSTCA